MGTYMLDTVSIKNGEVFRLAFLQQEKVVAQEKVGELCALRGHPLKIGEWDIFINLRADNCKPAKDHIKVIVRSKEKFEVFRPRPEKAD
jgi:hypothetical protein